jgi:hypothetical protein
MVFSKRISFIRKISISLFFFSFFSLIGSLSLQNALVSFKFEKGLDNLILKDISGFVYKEKINCTKNIEVCRIDESLNILTYSNNLGGCLSKLHEISYKIDNQLLSKRDYIFVENNLKKEIKPEYLDKDLEIIIRVLDKNEESCIKNYKSYSLYKIFPYYHELLYFINKDPKTELGAGKKINPFFNGETSISNIVKRYPINYVFKSLLFVSVIFMYLYWKNYMYLFREILGSKKEIFVFFGIASALFLFLHVLFLGMEIDNKMFKLLRKLIIVLFILSEIIAQTLLSIKLFKNKLKLNNFCNLHIINIKLIFVIIIALISTIVISMLLIFNLSSKVDYILEWNYFAGLLFYYLLSFLMWKKIN